MRREIAGELYYGRLVVLVVQGEGEDEPQRRQEDEAAEEQRHLDAGPVLDAALPEPGGVGLHGRVGDHLQNERGERQALKIVKK